MGPDDLSHVAFTSGSTGKPKAVLGRHAGTTAFLPFLAETFGMGRGDRQSMLSALSHDPLHRDVFIPLCLGGTVVAPDPEQLFTPGYLAGWVREREVSQLNLVPAMLQILTHGRRPSCCRRCAGSSPAATCSSGATSMRSSRWRRTPNASTSTAPPESQRALSYLALPRSLRA